MSVPPAKAALVVAVAVALSAAALFALAGVQRADALRSEQRDQALGEALEELAGLRSSVTSIATLGTASMLRAGPGDEALVLQQIESAGEPAGIAARVSVDGGPGGWRFGEAASDGGATWQLTFGAPLDTQPDGSVRRLELALDLETVRRRLSVIGPGTILLYDGTGTVLIDTRRPVAPGGALPTPQLVLAESVTIDGRPAVERPLGGATHLFVAVGEASTPVFSTPGPGTTVPVVLVVLAALLGAVALRRSDRRRQAAEERDPITGLINRAAFERELRREHATTTAILRLEVTPFGGLDDLGDAEHVDAVLLATGERLERTVRPGDTVARVGHREFAILARGVPDRETAELVGHRLRSRVGTSLRILGSDIPLVTSVGVAYDGTGGTAQLSLAARAGAALQQARTGPRSVVADVGGVGPLTPAALSAELRRALADGVIETHFQPVIDPATGQVAHVEALARWTHPEHGVIPPDVFVPAAEATGVVNELTAYVLDACIQRVVRWRDLGLDIGIAVNVSTVDLDEGFAEQVDALLRRYGCPASRIRLEVTETAMVHDLSRVQKVLTDLHERGVPIDVDDFGTGHASLAYVRGFPVSGVKIDRQFVSAMLESRTDALIVRSSIELVHALGMVVTAEGVEDGLTLDALRAWGCDRAQGYHIARPMPPAELEAMLEDGRLSAERLSI